MVLFVNDINSQGSSPIIQNMLGRMAWECGKHVAVLAGGGGGVGSG